MKTWHEQVKTLDNLFKTAPAEKLKTNLTNKLWRVENLYPIEDKQTRTLIPFTLNKFQRKIVFKILKNQTEFKQAEPIVVLKARQVGISTFFCIWFLDDVIFRSGINAVIMSYKKDSLRFIFRTVHTAFTFMYESVRPEIDRKMNDFKLSQVLNKHEISIPENRSRIESALEVRSQAVNRMLYSEYALTPPDRIAATRGSLTPSCVQAEESTPLGYNHFRDRYVSARKKDNAFFFPWFEHSEYSLPLKSPLKDLTKEEKKLKKKHNLKDEQLAYRRSKLSSMPNKRDFMQEYPEDDLSCFLSSGINPLSEECLKRIQKEAENSRPIHSFTQSFSTVRVYKKITPDIQKDWKSPMGVFVGIDPAAGTGGSFTALVAILSDIQGNGEVVMTIHGQDDPVQIADLAVKNLKRFFKMKNDNGTPYYPRIVVERNNHGHTTLYSLIRDHAYPKLYRYKDMKQGFVTTEVSRKAILHNLLFNAISQNCLKLNDYNLCQELITIEESDKRKIEAMQGKKDDLVLAAALAYEGVSSGAGPRWAETSEDEDQD